MKVKELKQGDRITQHVNHAAVAFEVLSVEQMGRRFMVTFRSVLGVASASYPGEASLSVV